MTHTIIITGITIVIIITTCTACGMKTNIIIKITTEAIIISTTINSQIQIKMRIKIRKKNNQIIMIQMTPIQIAQNPIAIMIITIVTHPKRKIFQITIIITKMIPIIMITIVIKIMIIIIATMIITIKKTMITTNKTTNKINNKTVQINRHYQTAIQIH